MAKIVWDAAGQHFYETGVKNCVLYVMGENSTYQTGVAWNGITAITESPSGAETTALYADDQKYLNLLSAEDFGATIEAYTYPDAFMACDGTAELVANSGAYIGQQSRKTFALCYKTTLGNDTTGQGLGYKLHIIYGATASPSEKAYSTINDSPEAITFSWELKTTPVTVTGFKPTAYVVLDSTKVASAKLTTIENSLFGTDTQGSTQGTDPTILLPDAIAAILSAT